MLEKIEYIFPNNKINTQLFDLFATLFENIPYATIDTKEINLISSSLMPKTVFRMDDTTTVLQLDIGNSKYLNLLNKNSTYSEDETITKLPIQDVKKRLKGHIKRVDHTGINLPSSLYSKKDWNTLLKYLASISNLYNYPTGEPWPFLIPSTTDENLNEINNFTILREPRFEIVYDDYTNIVTIQIDIETDLSKSEVETLFPKGQGTYFNSLENIFKTVYLDYTNYINIRLDIRFACSHSDFESGEWFVSQGKRIK